MKKTCHKNNDIIENIPLLSAANHTKKIKRFTKPKKQTKQLSEGANKICEEMYNNRYYSWTSDDDSEYIKKKSHPRTRKKHENVSKHKNCMYS